MVNNVKKSIWLLILMIFGMQLSFASVQVLDVVISELSYQNVTYNPLIDGSGIWNDTNERQDVYTLNGTINVSNTHPTGGVENIILNFTLAENIYNLAFDSGSTGIIYDYADGQAYATIKIPDLGPGSSSIFTYDINTTRIQPALNLTASYSDQKALSGTPLVITDIISNGLNSSYDDTCVYNINITQTAVQLNNSGAGMLNFTFNSTIGLSGHDATNATISADNLTIQWDVYDRGCLSLGDTTNITYTLQTPANVVVGADYKFSNSTISYRVNTTVSRMVLESIDAIADLDVSFQKQIFSLHLGDNATWQVTGNITSDESITVNVTEVSFWVSHRNAGGGGFTSPANTTNDTVTGASLNRTYYADTLINSSLTPWDNSGSDWFFNYTYTSSPIVWMDIEGELFNDGVQITNRTVTFGNNEIYTKEIYLVTGYWIEITRNITRLDDNDFEIFVKVVNRGNSATPADQIVVVYNFIHTNFTLTTDFQISNTTEWYYTLNTSTALTDPIYTGQMHQFAIMPNSTDTTKNPYNSSLDLYGSAENINNTWNLTYNVTGVGLFAFDDLFLTGVDPLQVKEIGSTKALTVENVYKVLSGSGEYILVGTAALVGLLLVLF